jgi:hypothetical protein
MRPTIKKTYECPETMVIKTTSQPLLINIGSGETTPESLMRTIPSSRTMKNMADII